MKRPLKEPFEFLPFPEVASPDDPDLKLLLRRTTHVHGIPQYEFEMRHAVHRYSLCETTTDKLSHHMGGCVLRIGKDEPYIKKAGIMIVFIC